MSYTEFGPFAHAFSSQGLEVPGYLELLDLNDDGSQIVIDRIQTALGADDSVRWIEALFLDSNWRPHLVGAIALLLDQGARLECAPLWQALDAGSWVTPQLVVTAFYVDPLFVPRLRERVSARCQIHVPIGLSGPERHSATGPAGSVARSAKLMASLLGVGSWIPSLGPWLAECATADATAKLLAQDIDGAPELATHWRSQLVRQFARRGVTLTPQAG